MKISQERLGRYPKIAITIMFGIRYKVPTDLIWIALKNHHILLPSVISPTPALYCILTQLGAIAKAHCSIPPLGDAFRLRNTQYVIC
jgi:hypothetical protein